MTVGESKERRIVVGVDGSPSSRAALRWAVRQAQLVDAVVDAVTTWEYPLAVGWSVPVSDVELAAGAGKALAECLEQEVGPNRPVAVHERVLPGNAAEVLLKEADGAEALVLGNRGHGGFTGAMLGSVGQHCVQHATCPVVIIRAS